MQLPRWNNCKNPRTRGKTAQPSISHSGQGLEGKKSSSLPVEGGIFSLTFPFIEQAISPLENCWRNGDFSPTILNRLAKGGRFAPSTHEVSRCRTDPARIKACIRSHVHGPSTWCPVCGALISRPFGQSF